MGRPRKPSNVLELNGAFRKDPNRRRATVKAPDRGVGPVPEFFDEVQARAWVQILRDAPPNVIKASDRNSLIALASLVAELEQAPYAFPAAKHGRLLALLQQFAMTPSSRENFSVKSDEAPPDDLVEFRA